MAAPTTHVPFSVNGKTALVTGAGSGINLCFAKLLLSKNCNVVMADIALRPEAEKVIDQHTSTGGPRAVFVETDVRSWDQLEHAFATADAEFGGADLVCPGAGIFEPHGSNFWHPPGSAASRDKLHGSEVEGVGSYALLDVNLTHPIRATQMAISRWLNPPAGSRAGKVSAANPKRVVHISSIAGQAPDLPTPLYMAAKHGLSGFIRSLAALEGTLGIRVNGVAPGIINTPLWTEHPEKMAFLDPEQDEWVEPEEVAEAMLRCVESSDVVGGWVLEVLKGRTRNVEAFNAPPPHGPGGTVSNRANASEQVFQWLAEPGWGVAQ